MDTHDLTLNKIRVLGKLAETDSRKNEQIGKICCVGFNFSAFIFLCTAQILGFRINVNPILEPKGLKHTGGWWWGGGSV